MLKSLQKTGKQVALSKSAIKQLRSKFFEHVKYQQEQIPEIWPKKGKVVSFKVKTGDDRKYQYAIVEKDYHFMSLEGHVVPDLKTVHKYPDLYPRFTVDEGAIKFILKGANVMAPGLLNEHSKMDEVEQGSIVSIYVYGHEHAVALGVTQKSTQEIRDEKQGQVVQTIHFIGDGFWNMLHKQTQQ